jgi:diguanylate cyclase (GGDEF)-like protein
VLAVLACLSVWELRFQDGGRVFLIGEDLWAGAQKRATLCLLTYSDTRSDQDLSCFRAEVDVVLGDMQARRELDKPRYEYSIVSEGLVRGRNRAQDVPTAIIFYHLAPWLGEVEKAVQIWRESDRYTLRLIAIAEELQHSKTAAETERLKQEVLEIDTEISGLERQFATHLNYGMHFLALCLSAAQGLAALTLIVFAVIVSRRMTAAREAAREKIHLLAYYDPLTGLANRTLLHERLNSSLSAAGSANKKTAVLYLDLDRFKIINDSLGHAVGDEILRETAWRLRRHVRDDDTVARVGGDEFLICLSNVEGVDDARAVAERILRALTADFVSPKGVPINVTCSIGISLFPEHGRDSETLIMNADAAKSRAKESGRNRFRFFADEMNEGLAEKLTLENSLHAALEKQQLYLEFQPEIDIKTGAVTAVEALLRWRHPDLGLVPPDKFIPVAESSGLIVAMGEWVLRTACAEARAWQDRAGLAPIPIAVNVSAVQFRQEGFCDLIRRVLAETRLAPQYLEIEVTESVLMSNEKATSETLKELKSMGLNLTIDDFGTGYSSLTYLRHFPVGKLKIDRSFIKDVAARADDAAITTAIIGMARSLGLKVVAEGVETEAQLAFLRGQGCDEAQGYYFSRPVAAEKLIEMLPVLEVQGIGIRE